MENKAIMLKKNKDRIKTFISRHVQTLAKIIFNLGSIKQWQGSSKHMVQAFGPLGAYK